MAALQCSNAKNQIVFLCVWAASERERCVCVLCSVDILCVCSFCFCICFYFCFVGLSVAAARTNSCFHLSSLSLYTSECFGRARYRHKISLSLSLPFGVDLFAHHANLCSQCIYLIIHIQLNISNATTTFYSANFLGLFTKCSIVLKMCSFFQIW